MKHIWYQEQHTLWRNLEDTPLTLRGDERCDSPGYSAKYCIYVTMGMDTGKIIDLETISVNEVSSSNAMEKEGLKTKRILDRLLENKQKIEVLCTDRHVGITAMPRDHYIKLHCVNNAILYCYPLHQSEEFNL